RMDDFTTKYLKLALFEETEVEIEASHIYNDIGLDWSKKENLEEKRVYEENEGWYWDGEQDAEGTIWGGCIESIGELLMHANEIPSLEQFKEIVLIAESSEEIPL